MELNWRYTLQLPMRRLFILLMIALLPLRSWAGDVMTLEMAVGRLASVTQTSSTMAHDCHGQNAEVSFAGSADSVIANLSESTDSFSDGRCDTCGTCQLCHSVALADFSLSELHSLSAPSFLSSDSTGFASAPRALNLKPPIS